MTSRTVYNDLKKQLKLFAFPPGEPISISDLSKRMNVSQTPLREELARLSSEGQLQHRPGRGYFMRWVDTETVKECYSCIELSLKHCINIIKKTGITTDFETNVTAQLQAISNTTDGISYSENIENLLHQLFDLLDNRYLKTAAKIATDQIYFLFPSIYTKENIDYMTSNAQTNNNNCLFNADYLINTINKLMKKLKNLTEINISDAILNIRNRELF